jgi:hypothetical protein
MPTTASVHVDSALSNVSIQYKNEELIADKILPFVSVAKRSDKYFKYGKGERFRRLNTLVGPKSRAGQVDFTVSTDNYSVQDHALEGFVSYADMRNADAPLDLLADETEFLTNLMLLDLEKEVADIVFASGTYATANKATPTTKWASAASTPIAQIITGINAIVGVPGPYSIAFGNKAWELFRQHPDVLQAIQPTKAAVAASLPDVANFFGFQDAIVGNAWINSALPNATDSYSRIWGDHVLIFKHAPGSLRTREAALGSIFLHNERKTLRWEDPTLGPDGGEWVKPSISYDVELTCADAGYLLYDVESA